MFRIFRERLFPRYFLLVAANLVFFILIATYVIYFVLAQGFMRRQFSQANINSLSGVGRSVEYFLKRTDDIAKYYSLFDQEAIAYSYREIASDSALFQFLRRLRNQRFIDGNIHSIYLYYPLQNRLIDISQSDLYSIYPDDGVPDWSQRQGTFYDTMWLPALRQPAFNRYGFVLLGTRPLYTVKDPARPTTVERNIQNQVPNANVITVIRALENRTEGPRGYVVANLNETALSQYLANANPDSPQVSMVITGAGVVVSHRDKSLLGADLSGEDSVRRVIADSSPDGFFISTVGGVSSAVVFVRSEYVDWVYVSVVPWSYVTSGLTSLTRIIVLIVALILVTATVTLYVLTRRAYSPVEAIFRKIRSISSDEKAQMAGDEARVIGELLDGFKRSYDHLGKLVFDNLYLLKYHFLNRLIAGELSEDERKAGLAEYHVRLGEGPFLMAAVAIDGMADVLKSYKLQDVFLLKQAIIDVAEKSLSEPFSAVGTNFDQAHVALVICGPNRFDRDLLAGRLADTIKMARQWLQVSISVGMGSRCSSLVDLKRSYDEALVALANRLHKGPGAVVSYDEVHPSTGDRSYRLSTTEEQVVRDLRSGQKEKCLQALHALVREIRDRGLSHAAVEGIFLELVVLIHRQFASSEEGFAQACGETFAQVLADVASFETLDQLHERMDGIFGRLAAYYAESKKGHNAEVVGRVMSYLQSHYDQVVTLDTIADNLRITPQYASRLIKDITGVNFLDYLTGIRMQKSEELLLKTGLSVREIAERVGYTCYRTFLMHFRAHTAMIPTQYRKTHNPMVLSAEPGGSA